MLTALACVWPMKLTPGSCRHSACSSVSTEGCPGLAGSTLAAVSPAFTSASVRFGRSISASTRSNATCTKPAAVMVRSSVPLDLTQKDADPPVASSARVDVLPSPRMT